SMLKAVRDKFNLVVYFKLVTHKLVRQVDSEMAPESLKFTEGEDAVEGGMLCAVSSTILRTVETIWAEDVFLYPIADKLWDLTLRLLEKHLAWARALLDAAKTNEHSELGGVESWRALLAARLDLNSLHSKVFDMALEQLWPKLSDMGVDTSLFGQCLTRFGILADAECAKIDEEVLDSVDTTGSSLSRFKRKGAGLDGTTDDDKIRTQIYRDLSFCRSQGLEKNIEVEGLSKLIERSRPDTIEPAVNGRSGTATPDVPEGTVKNESAEQKPTEPPSDTLPADALQ
ncbi:hypothetical protein ANCDUO_18686, partial [Ancylostoma duodenale]